MHRAERGRVAPGNLLPSFTHACLSGRRSFLFSQRSAPTSGQGALAGAQKRALQLAGIISALGIFFALPSAAQAASLYWVGDAGANTSVATNWKTTDPAGCGSGDAAAAPGSSDIAIFDADCDNGATINAALNVSGINIQTGYIGTVTQSNGATLTIGADDYVQADGTFTGGDATSSINLSNTADFNLSGGTFTAPAGNMNVSLNFTISGGTFNDGSGTVVFESPFQPTIDVVTTETFNNLTFAAPSNGTIHFIANGDTLVANGTLTLGEGRVFAPNTTDTATVNAKGSISVLSTHDGGTSAGNNIVNLLIDGASSQSFAIPVGAVMPKTTLNQSATTISTSGSGTVTFAQVLVLTSGTFDGGANTIDLNGGITINGGTYNATTGETRIAKDWSHTSGTFTHNSSTVVFDGNATQALDGETFYNMTVNNSAGTPSASADVDSSAAFTVENTLNVTDGQLSPSNNSTFKDVTIGVNGLLVPDTSTLINVSGDWSNAGVFTSAGASQRVAFTKASGTQTLNSGGTGASQDFTRLTKSGGGTLQVITNGLVVGSVLTISSGTTIDLNGQNLTAGSLDNPGTLQLEGGETVTITTPETAEGTVLYDGSGTYTQLAVGDAYYNLTFNGTGSWTLDAALDVNNTLTITDGTLDVSATNHAITVGGNWANSDTFTAQGGTVTFDGTNQTISGATTFYDLTKTESSNDATNSTWTFPASTTTTVSNTWTVDGLDSDDKIALVSSSGGTRWNISPTGTRAIDNATVTDSNNTSGTVINESGDATVTSGGNNVGWVFDADSDFIWLGTTSSWTTGSNWSGGAAPGASDTAVFDGAVSNANATTGADINVGGISIEADYTGTITQNASMTVGSSDFTQAGGTYTISSGATDINGDFTLSGGTFTAPSSSFAFTVSGNWSVSGATFNNNSGTVTFDGSVAQTLTGTTFYNVTIANTAATPSDSVDVESSAAVTVSNTLTVSDGQFSPFTASDLNIVSIGADGIVKPAASGGTLTVAGSWTNSGTFTANLGTVNFDGTGSSNSITPGSSSFYNLTVSGTGTWDAAAALTASNALTLSAGVLDLSGFDLSAGSFTTGGTLRLNGNETSVTSPSNLTSAGTVAYDNSSTVSSPLLGASYYNFTVAGSGTVQFPSAFDVNNNLTVSSGTLDFNGFDLNLAGNFSDGGSYANTSARTITFDGGDQTITPGTLSIATLAITGSSGEVAGFASVTVSSDITIASGRTMVVSGGTLTSNGSITNAGIIVESFGLIVDHATNFYIADENFDEDNVISLGADKVYVTITEEDGNLNGSSADTLSVTVSCPTDSEAVTLTETGNATEVFRNSGGLTTAAYDGSATNNDGTLECNDAVTITASYTDSKDDTDTESDTATATSDTLPTAPSSFAGSADSSTAITWTWTDNANNEDGFKLLDTNNNVIATIATPNATSYTETGLTELTSYTRKVVAYNDAGNSTASNTATVETEAGVPAAPSSLSGSAASSTSIVWSWTDNADNESGFKFYNAETDALIATISTASSGTGQTASYTETGLTRGTTYRRYVKAFNDNGDSTATSDAEETTLTSQPAAFSLTSPANGALLATGLPSFTWPKTTDDDDGLDYYSLVIDSVISLRVPKDGASSSNPAAHTHYADGFIAQYFNENDGDPSNDRITVTLRVDATDRFPLADGAHSWYVTARDTAGNTRSTGSRTFTVDTAAPLLTNTQFSVPTTRTGSTYRLSSTTPTVTLTFSDGLGLAQATVTLEEGTTTLGVITSYTARQTSTYTLTGKTDTAVFTPRTPLTRGGNYRIRILARDTAGNARETTLRLQVLTAQEAARAEVAELDADATPVDTIVEKLRDTLPDSPFSLPDFSAHALLRRQKEAAAFDDFLTRFKQSWLVQLVLMNTDLFARPFLALQASWEWLVVWGHEQWLAWQSASRLAWAWASNILTDGARQLLAGGALLRQMNTQAQQNLQQAAVNILTSLGATADYVATLPNTIIAIPAARTAATLQQLAQWAATSPPPGQGYQEERAQTGATLAALSAQARTVGNVVAQGWAAGRETRVREGVRNRQRIEGGLTRLLTPLQQGGKRLATRLWATYELWTNREPTQISNVRVTALTPTTAVIEWDTNHFTRTAAVNYGPTTSYGQKVIMEELTNRHRVEIVELDPATTYYFEIMNQNGDYVYDAYYTLTTPAEDTLPSAVLTPQDARFVVAAEVRKSPEPEAAILTALPAGTVLRALSEQGVWISVLLPTGAEGWVLREHVELLPQQAGPSADAQHSSTGTE